MPSPPPTGTEAPQGGRPWVWSWAIVVLGLNLWVGFLLLPTLHLPAASRGAPLWLLLLAPPAALLWGVRRHSAVLLLAGFPLLLLVPPLGTPQLVGANVYTPGNFAFIVCSLTAYVVVTPLAQRLGFGERQPVVASGLEGKAEDTTWQRRRRVYRALALLAGIFPATLFGTLFLHPAVRSDVERHFPGRLSETLVLFGLLLLLLWLGLFHFYFLGPLKAHARGDPAMRHELRRLQRKASRRTVGAGFYLAVGAAVVSMLLLLLRLW